MYSWAVTYNKHEQGNGELGYIGGWDVNVTGALFGWNELPGWIGSAKVGKRDSLDTCFVGNRAGGGEKPMKGAQLGDGGCKLQPPSDVRAEPHQGNAVKITWRDVAEGEVGYRVDRRIGDGRWTPIAYRPPQIGGDAENLPKWIDFLAPTGKPLVYRVVALDSRDTDRGASAATPALTLEE